MILFPALINTRVGKDALASLHLIKWAEETAGARVMQEVNISQMHEDIIWGIFVCICSHNIAAG